MITSFSGDNRFLSNFYPTELRWSGEEYMSAEHLYQARKTPDALWHDKIRMAASAATAKRIGQQVPIAPDWDRRKVGVMEEIIRLKFRAEMGQQLLDTGDELLVEGNTWHDQFWGDCHCTRHATTPGKNALGIILMRVRLDLNEGTG